MYIPNEKTLAMLVTSEHSKGTSSVESKPGNLNNITHLEHPETSIAIIECVLVGIEQPIVKVNEDYEDNNSQDEYVDATQINKIEKIIENYEPNHEQWYVVSSYLMGKFGWNHIIERWY